MFCGSEKHQGCLNTQEASVSVSGTTAGKGTITVIKYRAMPLQVHLEVPQTLRRLGQQSGIWELQHHHTCWDHLWRHLLSSASPGRKREHRPQAMGAHGCLFPHAFMPYPLLHMSKGQGGVQATDTLEEGFAPWRDLMGRTDMENGGKGWSTHKGREVCQPSFGKGWHSPLLQHRFQNNTGEQQGAANGSTVQGSFRTVTGWPSSTRHLHSLAVTTSHHGFLYFSPFRIFCLPFGVSCGPIPCWK